MRQRTSPWTTAQYEAYRARFPYSDEEITEAIKVRAEEAAQEGSQHMRDHYLSWLDLRERFGHFPPFVLKQMLPYVIKVCAICGASAHYRQGNDGRCRTHKDITTDSVTARRLREEQRHKDLAEVERKRKIADHLRAFHKARGV